MDCPIPFFPGPCSQQAVDPCCIGYQGGHQGESVSCTNYAELVAMALRHPIAGPIFACKEPTDVALALRDAECYRVCGCNSDISVILAAAHNVSLGQMGPILQTAQLNAAIQGDALPPPLPPNRSGGANSGSHWTLTIPGLQWLDIASSQPGLAGGGR